MTNHPGDFNNLAKTVFAPVNPVIARQIVDRCKIKRGNCIDIRSGLALLTIALAEITDLSIYALDISENMYEIAKENIEAAGLSGRITPIVGDVHDMPFDDNAADLIMSRGSVFFWDERADAFKEIYRVLKPDGRGYIGGGLGTAELRANIIEEMEKRDANWKKDVEERIGKNGVEKLKEALDEAKIPNYEVMHDDSGLWILIEKVEE
jgi:ubiquinone/menaquinone biosynthesis C-methylase UbiE